MIPVAAAQPHTDAAVQAIEDAVAAVAGTAMVGRGRQPDGSGWQGEPYDTDFRPYVIIYPSPGTIDGSVAEPAEYLDFRMQATCVSATQDGAIILADLVRSAWVNEPLSVAGRVSYRGQLMIDQQATRDDSVAPPVHYSIIQVTWRTQAT